MPLIIRSEWAQYSLLIASLVILTHCDSNEKAVPVPPIPAIVVSPDNFLTTTLVRFDCTASQPGNKGDKLYFRWDWDNNGTWDTDYSAEPVFLHRYYSKGTHIPVMEALNSSGLTDTCSLKITVDQGYSAPRALFRLIPESGHRLTEFTFDATLTKDDEDSLDQLQFRWDWEGDGRWETGFGHTPVISHTYNDTGTYQPSLEVIDPSGLKNQYQQKLEVNQVNTRLFVHFDWSPSHPLQEDTVLFDASLSRNPDDSSNTLIYWWNFSTGEPMKSGEWIGPFNEPTISRIFKMEHTYWATLKILDNRGLENRLTRMVEIFHLNRPPVPKFIISTQLGNLTTQFYLNAWNTTDIEDLTSAVKVRWDFEGDGRWDTEYSLEKILYHKYSSPGTYKIILKAMDPQGLTDTTSLQVKVTSGTNETGLVIDRRYDAQEFYPTVKIGNQWWMAKNMYYEPRLFSDKIDTTRSYCYYVEGLSWKILSARCKYYGFLYTAYSATSLNQWERAQGICPDGWHIPTRNEWKALIDYIGGYSAARELLPGGSTDFNALYAGWGEERIKTNEWGFTEKYWVFQGQGSMTYFWSSTPLQPIPPAMSHWNVALIKDNDKISTGYSGNNYFLSVRCIKNE